MFGHSLKTKRLLFNMPDRSDSIGLRGTAGEEIGEKVGSSESEGWTKSSKWTPQHFDSSAIFCPSI